MREYIDESTGEIVAVLSLSTWEALVRDARAGGAPCDLGACTSPTCSLVRGVLLANQEREPLGGELRPRLE